MTPRPQRAGEKAPSATRELERDALRLLPDVYRLACRLLGGTTDADDVVQDAFMKALTELRRGAFRGDSGLSTWLYRITTNVALDRLRARRRLSPADPPAPEPATAGNADARVELRELAESLTTLPEDQRAALVLKELQGLTTREVATILERSEGAVEQLLVRARDALRRRFEP